MGNFYFEGGGGTEGDLGAAIGLTTPGEPSALTKGYAVVSQDSGDDNAMNSVPSRGGNVAFGLIHRHGQTTAERLSNWSRKQPRQSFTPTMAARPSTPISLGCSKGGQEGMVFAQRFPDEFDGIVAGAPGFALPRAAVAEAWDTQSFGSLVAATGAKTFDPKLLPTTLAKRNSTLRRKRSWRPAMPMTESAMASPSNFESCTWPRVAKQLKREVCSSAKTDPCLSEAQIMY